MPNPEPPAPTPGLLASLSVRTWIEHTKDDEMFAAVLVTHPTPQFEELPPGEIEQRMRGVAAAFGAIPYINGMTVPLVGARIMRAGDVALLRVADCPYGLKVVHPRWVRTLGDGDTVLLAVGTDALSRVASRSETYEYRLTQVEAGRMHVALAQVVSSARNAQTPLSLAHTGGGR